MLAGLVVLFVQLPALGQTARWETWVHLPLVVDVAGPRSDGSFVATAGGRLHLVTPGRGVRSFALTYKTSPGTEPYIAMGGAGCFERDDVFALEARKPFGLVRIDALGHPSRFAEFTGVEALTGIALDTTGSFGHRLLVTAHHGTATVLFAIDCRGKTSVVAKKAPLVEGGIAVAPATFGEHAGKLIAPDERTGNVVAIARDGSSSVIARSGLPSGGDIGVESLGFVPAGFAGSAYLADRSSPNSPTKGTDSILTMSASALRDAGVRDGDLVVATEAVGRTIAVRCTASCTVTKIGEASKAAHSEGKILFTTAAARSRASHPARFIAFALGVAALLVALAGAVVLTVRARTARSPSPP